MNARLYDPTIGRFISADSMIDGMYRTQGYNRYSYVSNNPLKYVDPTGHFIQQIQNHPAVKGTGKAIEKAAGETTKFVNSVGSFHLHVIDSTIAYTHEQYEHGKAWTYEHRREIATVAIIAASGGLGTTAVGAMGISGTFTGAVVSGAISGAVSGYAIGRIYGANHSQALSMARSGARSGAISGVFTFGVKQGVPPEGTEGYTKGWTANKMMFRATMGGLKSAALGQDVGQGMVMGAVTSLGDVDWSSSSKDSWHSFISEPVSTAYGGSYLEMYVGDPLLSYYKEHETGLGGAIDSL